jgi:hypothetical protein
VRISIALDKSLEGSEMEQHWHFGRLKVNLRFFLINRTPAARTVGRRAGVSPSSESSQTGHLMSPGSVQKLLRLEMSCGIGGCQD